MRTTIKGSRLLCVSALLFGCPGDPGSTSAGGSSGGTGGETTGGTAEPGTGGSTSTPTTGAATGSSGDPTSGTGEPGSTGDGTTGAPADESVTLLDEPCEKSPPAASRCERYEVVCEGLAPAIVDLAFYQSDAAIPSRGTVLFGSGGDGTGFYNFTQAKPLLDAGFTIVDRRWPAGWFTGATDGPQQAACRLAALIRHLRKNPPAGGPLCATGNSGGSAELGFALTWQNAGPSLDFAMPTSGPFHRLDLACQGDADATWSASCEALREGTCPDCLSTGCQLGNGPRMLMDVAFAGTPRCTAPGPGDLEVLKDRSPEFGPDVAGLGELPIHIMIGKNDPGAYQPLATALQVALAAAGALVDIEYVDGAEHEMDSTPPGAEAIRDAILSRCVALP